MNTTTHAAIIAELRARWPEHKIVPTMNRIEAICELLGDPHRAIPVIQVAGTNGKGSTCIIIEQLLMAMGLRVGRFSSPHLEEIGERITIDAEPLSPEHFDEIYQQIKPLADIVDNRGLDGVPMTFFEFMTAMAFAAFVDAPVDVAVLEVGMGGTWDSTNVADAAVAVIAPVDFDHMHILGESIEEIAANKAGIIKAGSVAVLAGQRPDVAKILLARCLDQGVKPVLEGQDFGVLGRKPAVGGQVLRLLTADGPLGDLFLPLFGRHMAQNASLAVAAVEAFFARALPPEALADGLAAVKAPARLEIVRHAPTIILDTGHNPAGARATVDAMQENFVFAPLIGVLSAMKDKDIRRVAATYAEIVDTFVCTQVTGFDRCLPAGDLAQIVAEIVGADRVRTVPRMADAIEMSTLLADQGADLSTGEGTGGVLIAGSVIAAGEARSLLVHNKDIP